MIPDEITPIDDRLLDELLAADEAMARSAAPRASGDESWLGDCLRLLEMVWPSEGATAAPRRGGLPLAFGRFEVVREVGRGGFGVVYLARDRVLGRNVALKIPLPERLASPEGRRRFMREAHASAVLDHPKIVPVFEAAERGPIAYIASAYCDGPSLSAWLKTQCGAGAAAGRRRDDRRAGPGRAARPRSRASSIATSSRATCCSRAPRISIRPRPICPAWSRE